MTSIDDHPITAADRYAKAVNSTDLSPGSERERTDADVLLAAAYATGDTCKACNGTGRKGGAKPAMGVPRCEVCDGRGKVANPRKQLALAAYRLGLAGDTAGLRPLIDEMDSWLLAHLAKGGNRPMPAAARQQLIRDTLKWWLDPACGYCNANGFVLVEGTSRLSPVECDACHGTKKRSLRREIQGHRQWADHAEYLVDELDRLKGMVFGDMARMLNGRMDEALGGGKGST